MWCDLSRYHLQIAIAWCLLEHEYDFNLLLNDTMFFMVFKSVSSSSGSHKVAVLQSN